MSGYAGHEQYDDGYGHHQGNADSYYQDENGQYYDQGYDAHGGQQAGDGYYDESYVCTRDIFLDIPHFPLTHPGWEPGAMFAFIS